MLHEGSLNLIINLEIGNDETIRRASGRKFDPVTETIYHMEDNPPPNDVINN